MKMTRLSIIMMILALVATPAFGQRRMQAPPPDNPREEREFAPEQGPDAPPPEERREEIRKKIETIRIWRLTERLRLDTATIAKLAPFLGSLDQRRKEILQEQATTMRELDLLVKFSKPDEAKIKAALDRLEKNQQAIHETRRREIDGLKAILTVEQQARFLLFQQEFERELREMIAGARGGGGPVGGRPGLRPPPEGFDKPFENR
jgi:Spy/CpxP family protein refolding chaperone